MQNSFITPSWNAPANIRTIITTKLGNNSHNLGFNLATHVNDNAEIVYANREVLRQKLPTDPYWLLQTHSNNVLDLDTVIHKESEYKDFDAAITFSKNKVCVVLTADCIPIFLTNTEGTFVASIHAGRIGIAKKIIAKVIAKSNTFGHKIIAYIGPSICAKHYEVGGDIFKEFCNLDQRYRLFFQEKSEKYELDLSGIAKLQLIDCGLLSQNIYSSNICTFCNHEEFYSYRHDKNTGRFASLIWME